MLDETLAPGDPGHIDQHILIAQQLNNETGAFAALTIDLSDEVARATAAENIRIPLAQKGAVNGVATLDGAGRVPATQQTSNPYSSVTVVANQAAMLALTGLSVTPYPAAALRLDNGFTYVLTALPASTLANWDQLPGPVGGGVVTVDGDAGPAVSLVGSYDPLGAANAAKARSTHTGTQSADTLTDGTTNKAFLATERTKLAGIEALADVTDAANVLAAGAIMTTGAQSKSGVLTFASLPIIPVTTPTVAGQAASKQYVDDQILLVPSGSGAGSATIVVAANNAPATVKARADYVCDGTADEVQLNAALATGTSVVMTDGTYSINAPIKMEYSGQSFTGAGTRYQAPGAGGNPGSGFGTGTIIRPSATFAGSYALKCEKDSSGFILGRITVSGFSIDGQLSAATFDGILFRAFQSTLHTVDVQYCTQDGIVTVGNEVGTAWATYDTRVYNVRSANNGRYGFNLRGSSAQDTHISQAIFHNNGTAGLFLGGASHQIVSMHCYTNGLNGILSNAGGGARTKFIGCKIEHSGGDGVLFSGGVSNPVQVQFVGCNFSSNGETTTNIYSHLKVSGASANLLIVSACTFATTDAAPNIAKHCMDLGAAPNASIIGNTINSNAFATSALNVASNSATEQTIKIFGNQEIQDYVGSSTVTATMQAGAGTTPPAAVIAGYSRNREGGITWGTGTTPAAGGQVAIVFGTNEIPRIGGSTAPSRIMVIAKNTATANLNPYVSAIAVTSGETTGFTIGLGTAPSASQANTVYAVDWVLIP